jgi:hypothetical protein
MRLEASWLPQARLPSRLLKPERRAHQPSLM